MFCAIENKPVEKKKLMLRKIMQITPGMKYEKMKRGRIQGINLRARRNDSFLIDKAEDKYMHVRWWG